MSFDHTIYTNNLAIGFLRQGNYASAGRSFLAALCQLPPIHSFVDFEWRRNDLTAKHARHLPVSQAGLDLISSKYMHWVKICEPRNKDYSSTPTGPSMYSFAVSVSAAVENKYGVQEIPQQIARAAVLYNLAFLYHWRAMHAGVSSSLWQALRFYEEAAEAVQRLEGCGAECGHLAIALLNNMGHIHFQLLQYNEARQCFGCLRLHLSSKVGSIRQLQRLDDYHIFVMNAMLPLTEVQLAPAA